jgi:tripartite-type tricarboxylate transporter receptor subunit TctC
MEQAINRMIRAGLLVLGVALSWSFGSGPAGAQGFPTKPVRIFVALGPGSATDVLVRAIAPRLGEAWRQPVIVENRPGGAGAVAGQAMLNADADGHTLMAYSDGHAVNAALNADLPYDTLRDIARVSQLATFSTVLVTAPSFGVSSMTDLIVFAKANPGKLTFGSAGIGGGLHFSGEMFKIAAGITATHVPYKGTPDALADVISGRVNFMFAPVGSVLGHLKARNLVALAAGSARRSPLLPELQTVAEGGVAGFQYELWAGLFAPAKTPASILGQIAGEVARVMALAEIREPLARQGFVYRPNMPEDFDRMVRLEVDTLRQVAATARISVK